MPPPTRQQFDAASKRVLATAPAGLSREQFFALIDKDIQGGDPATWTSDGGKVVYDTPGGAQATKLENGEIPSTWIGGFLRSIKDDFLGNPRTESSNPSGYKGWGSRPSGAPEMKSLLEHSAQPETIGDMLGMLLPNAIGRSANLGIETEKAGQASSRAVRGTGTLNRVRSYWKGVGQDINTPTQTLGSGPHEPVYAHDQELLGLTPETPTPRSVPSVLPPAPKGDLYDLYRKPATPTAPGQAPRVFKPGTAPPATAAPAGTLEEALLGPLSDARGVDARISSLPPEPAVAGEGALKQSGTFPAKSKVGQAGGYTSGRPGVTPDKYDELVAGAEAAPAQERTLSAPTEPPGEPIIYGGQTLRPGDEAYDKIKALMERQAPQADRVAAKLGQAQPNPSAEVVGAGPVPEPDALAEELMGGASSGSQELRPLPAEPDPLARELLGPTSKVNLTSLNPETIKPEEWPGLRRHYGTKRLSELTGIPPELIEEMAPGPSRIPIEVEDRINQNPLGVMKYLP